MGAILNVKEIIKDKVLKNAASQNIFCPKCSKVLDWKTTVTFTADLPSGITVDMTMCLDCYKEIFPNLKVLRSQGWRFYKIYRKRVSRTSKN